MAPIAEEVEEDDDDDDDNEGDEQDKEHGDQQGAAKIAGPDVPMQRSGVSDVMAVMSVMTRAH